MEQSGSTRFRWSRHALENLVDRRIDREAAEAVLLSPDSIVEGRFGRRVLMGRYFDKDLASDMLLRIIVEDAAEETIVVTLYKTSRVDKYLPTQERGEKE
jgi:hypothetical protein